MMSPILTPDLDDVAKNALEVLKLIESTGTEPFHDLWDSYAEERDGIVELLTSARSQPIVISGDVHISVEGQLSGFGREIPEWTIPSVTSQNLDDKKGWAKRTKSLEFEDHVLQGHTDWTYCNFDDHGYALIEVTTERVTCQWKFIEEVLARDDGVSVGHVAFRSSAS